MTKRELKKIISDSQHFEYLEGLEASLVFRLNNTIIPLKGIYEAYYFFHDEQEKWNQLNLNDQNGIFKETFSWLSESIKYFNSILSLIQTDTTERQIQSYWDSLIPNRHQLSHHYLFDFKETQFILNLLKKNNSLAQGADAYFFNKLNSSIFNDSDHFKGLLLAYEFSSEGLSELSGRKNDEKLNLNSLRKKYDSLVLKLEETEINFKSSLNHLQTNYKSSLKEAEDYHKKQLSEIENQFLIESNKLTEETDGRFKIHEETYTKLLQLKKPADHWQKRADDLKKSGEKWMCALIISSVFGLVVIVSLVFSLQGEKIVEHIKNPAISIRWSILSVVLLTLIAFMIRVFTKMMMSNFHLYRDAQERKQLTYLYLSLINEASVSDTDRTIVLQALFSRADTGLLKEDSSPTMPNVNIEKLAR
jgi:hypothetical protein